MKLSPPSRCFTIIAQDPDAGWRSDVFQVDAASDDEAKHRARVKLAEDRRDHWSVEIFKRAA